MMETETVPRPPSAPPGPDLPGQLTAFQRKAERHKAAIARLETTLVHTKRRLRAIQADREILLLLTDTLLPLLAQDRTAEATLCIEEARTVVRAGTPEARQHTLARARNRDTALQTLRATVKILWRGR